MKTIVVETYDWSMEHQLDPFIFDGDTYAMYREAVMAVLEKKRTVRCRIGAVFECYEKKNAKKSDTHVWFNSYYVLIRARHYEKAMELREKAKLKLGVDLREEIEHD